MILAGTGIGFKASDNLCQQQDMLKKLKKMIILLRGEIKYNNTYISQAFENVSDKIAAPYKGFLLYLAARLDENCGKPFSQLWREAVEVKLKDCGLVKHQLQKICELGDILGFLDKEMQLAAFDLFTEQLEAMLEENSLKMKDNSRLYKCLGFMGGILVVLVIT